MLLSHFVKLSLQSLDTGDRVLSAVFTVLSLGAFFLWISLWALMSKLMMERGRRQSAAGG